MPYEEVYATTSDRPIYLDENHTLPDLNLSFGGQDITTVPPDPWEKHYTIAGALLLPIDLALFLGNALMFFAILDMLVTERNRGSPVGPVLVLNLAVADILVGIMSLMSVAEIGGADEDENFGLCLVMVGFIVTPCIASFMIMAAIAVSRYFAVLRPFREEPWPYKKAAIISTVIWTVATLIGFTPAMGLNDDLQEHEHCGLLSVATPGYILGIYFGFFIPLVIALMGLYIVMCKASRDQKRRIAVPEPQERPSTLQRPTLVVPEPAPPSEAPRQAPESPSTLQKTSADVPESPLPSEQSMQALERPRGESILTVCDSGISTAPASEHEDQSPTHFNKAVRLQQTRSSRSHVTGRPRPLLRRQSTRFSQVLTTLRPDKSLRTTVLIVGCFVFMWGPLLTTAAIQVFCGDACQLQDIVNTYLVVLGVANSAINPVVYISTDKRLKKHFCHCLFHSSGTLLMPSSAMYSSSSDSQQQRTPRRVRTQSEAA